MEKLRDFVREVTNFVLTEDFNPSNTKVPRGVVNPMETCVSLLRDHCDESESDSSDSELNNDTDIILSDNSEEDVAELKVLVEYTTGKRVPPVANAMPHIKENITETTNGSHCEDYKEFVREKTNIANESSKREKQTRKKKVKKTLKHSTVKKSKLHNKKQTKKTKK